MPKEKFEVGEKEKHYFTVSMDMGMRRVEIEQDGRTVVNELRLSPFLKKFQFDVGSSEPHHVEIAVGLFRRIELKVDGRPVHPPL